MLLTPHMASGAGDIPPFADQGKELWHLTLNLNTRGGGERTEKRRKGRKLKGKRKGKGKIQGGFLQGGGRVYFGLF